MNRLAAMTFFCLTFRTVGATAGATPVTSAFGFSNEGRLALRGQPAAGVQAAENSSIRGTLKIEPEWTPFGTESLKDSALPIQPGKSGESPFWNGFAHQFIHAPAFEPKK